MDKSFSGRLSDWLLVLIGVNVIIWFVMTSPMLPTLEAMQNSVPVSQDGLKQHVVELSQTYSPRMAEFENLRPPAGYIRKQFAQYGKVKYQFFKTGVGTFRNVVASFGPDSKDILVIGAHYDSHDGLPGADGNASGVAGLIELARMLSVQKNLPMKIELVAYALAEGAYFGTKDMGSFYHAESLKKAGRNVKLMISLDGIGYFDKESGSQKYPYKFMRFFYPGSGDFIRITGRLQDVFTVRKVKKSFSKVDNLEVRSLNAPEVFPSVGRSDHRNYWLQGYPAVMVSDTGGDRNPAFHTEGDVADKLDYERMALVVQGVYQTIVDVLIQQYESEHKVTMAKKD
jgi:hypothetical protein